MRFSLRTLLAAIVFCAMACAALKNANEVWWTVVSSAALLLVMAMMIIALVGGGQSRAFAIGFTVCAVIYGAIMFDLGVQQLDMYRTARHIPTTQSLVSLYGAMVEERYYDARTGEHLPDYQPPEEHGGVLGFYNNRPLVRSSTPGVQITRVPQSRTFMAIGHVLWAVLLGFVGGQFARFIYRQRDDVQTRIQQGAET